MPPPPADAPPPPADAPPPSADAPSRPAQAAPGGAAALASTERKVRLGLGLALACLLVVGIASAVCVMRLNENAASVARTHDVLDHLELLLAAATDSEAAERGYVITGEESYFEAFRQAGSRVLAQAVRLRALTRDEQRQRLDSVLSLLTERFEILRKVIDLRKSQGFAAAQREVATGEGEQFHDRLRGLIDQMQSAETAQLQLRVRRTDQSSRLAWTVIAAAGLLACAIVALSLLAIRRDFAGRARAERALRGAKDELEARVVQRAAQLALSDEMNARLASIVAFSDDAIISKDLAGIITSWNPGAQRLFGYRADEAVGKPMTMLIPRDRADEEPAILERIARGETTDHFETVRLRKDGGQIDVSVTISPIRDAQGRIIGASKIARDITDRRLADSKVQAQLARLGLLQQITRAIGERQDIRSIFQVVIRTLEEQLPVDFCCICLHDPADDRLIVTSIGTRSEALAMELAMTEQSRIETGENGLSRCVQGRLVYEPDITQLSSPFAQRLAQGALRAMAAAPLLVESKVFGVLIAARRRAQSFSSGECEFLRQTGEHVALAAHQAQLYGSLQQAYEDLRQTQKAVMQQERLLALGQMASGIAHDINNAISPVTLYTEALLEKEPGLSARGRGYLEIIQRAIDDVAQTVARMREFYRPREPLLNLTLVDVNRLVGQVIDLTRARWSDMAQQRGIAIEMRTELAPALPAILAAENEIRDALTNVIFNAVDAMPQGGPLTVRTRVAGEGGAGCDAAALRQVVQIEVMDTGVGMNEDTRRRCLEPFFTTKGERGTGLGLAMVYGTMQRHGAEIEIDSAIGEGTTMRFSFAIPAAAGPGSPLSRSIAPLPAQRILVVDDDPLVLKSLRDALEAEGHSVTTADGGQAGIDAFMAARAQGRPFPVVITDLGMPYIDGRRVSSAIKTAAPATVVLLLTGWGQRLSADGEVPPHVDRVLSKPPRMRELRDALALCLDAAR